LLDWGLRLAFLLALPAAVGLGLLALPLVSTLYQYGKFTAADALQTQNALLGYSVGLLGLILVKILAPGFYAKQVMRTPVKIAFLTVVITQALAVLLAWVVGLGPAGLTLATGIGACINAGLLFWLLRKNGFYAPRPGWLSFVGKVAVALAVLGAILVATSGAPAFWLHAGLWEKAARLAGVTIAGAAGYFAALYLLGFRFADFNRRD
jgi:putative peptidoglycan lipid II flippase